MPSEEPISEEPSSPDANIDDRSLATEASRSPSVDLQLGKYRLLERIGEGGMGEVYIAEQREPYYQQVAVKLIKSATLNSEGIKHYLARFEAERQALALMNHPNIAKVFDGGATPIAGPYIVMELCLGSPLIEYCRQHKLDLQGRLELFLQVCQAVEHAHQKGIIHRDLKPSNIIVSSSSKSPTVKVIDFGLAKALQPALKLTDKTLHTHNGIFLGTYKYTSPEQAAADNEDIDTRSDIYSLGIILYELLTDTTPIDDQFVAKNNPSEILRAIREVDPARPSSVAINSDPSKSSTASVLRQNVSAIRNELDWITLKAIQKERKFRYQTASALADDIHHFLRQEPITARPPSQIYRLRKFASRNRAFVSAAAAVFVAISVAAVVFGFAYKQARDNYKQALDNEVMQGELLKAQNQQLNEASEREKAQQTAIRQEQIAKAATEQVLKEQLLKEEAITAKLEQESLAKEASQEALRQEQIAKAAAQEALKQEKLVAQSKQERIIEGAATAKKAAMRAWSIDDHRTAIEQLLQALRLDPADKSSQAWLYAMLADKANVPPQDPDLVFGGDSQTKKTLLSREGTVILHQDTNDKLSVYSVAAMMNTGVDLARRGNTFSLAANTLVFDIFWESERKSMLLLTGSRPSPDRKPTITVLRFDGQSADFVSSYESSTQFYSEPFFGPTGQWYVFRGGNDYVNRSLQTYSIIDSLSGTSIQSFADIQNTGSFAISPDGTQVLTTGKAILEKENIPSSNPHPSEANQQTNPEPILTTEPKPASGLSKDTPRDGLESSSLQPTAGEQSVATTNNQNPEAVLFDVLTKKLIRIPLSSYSQNVGFEILGETSVVDIETVYQVPEIITQEESHEIEVPVTKNVTEEYTVKVPVVETLKDGTESTTYIEKRGTRTRQLTEMRKVSVRRTINREVFVDRTELQSVLTYDRKRGSSPFITTGLETSFFDRHGNLKDTLRPGLETLLMKLKTFQSSNEYLSQPKQIQSFPVLNAVGIRYSGSFHLFRIPSTDKLEGDWPAILWTHFPASPFEEPHAQPKFNVAINQDCDTIAVPMSVNRIHLYRLSTSLPPLPAPVATDSKSIHFHVSSTRTPQKWIATSHLDKRNKLSLKEIRPNAPPVSIELDLKVNLKEIGEVFIHPSYRSLVLSDHVPPARPGFCVDGCGPGGVLIPNEVVVAANGTPKPNPNAPRPLEPTIATPETKGTNGSDKPEAKERSLLESNQKNITSLPDGALEGLQLLDLYQDYPLARFSLLSFPEGNVFADELPGIFCSITQGSPIALVRNYNRLYFYDLEKQVWSREPLQFEAEVTSAQYAPNGKLFAVGTKTGLTIWFESNSFLEIGRYQLEDEVAELEFNATNDYLAIQTSDYLPLPKGVESNSFCILQLSSCQKIYHSQLGLQFRGFSPDGSRVLLQNQVMELESFVVMELPTLKEVSPLLYPPLARKGLHVSFVNNDLISVTEGRETWLYSCNWQAPASPRFIHPDVNLDSYFTPRPVSIDNGDTVTLAYEAAPSIRSWQVELPLRRFDDISFSFSPAVITEISRTIRPSQTPNPIDTAFNATADQALSLVPEGRKWYQLLKWRSSHRSDRSLWPDAWSPSSTRMLSDTVTNSK